MPTTAGKLRAECGIPWRMIAGALVASVVHAAPPKTSPTQKSQSRPAEPPSPGSVEALLVERDGLLARHTDGNLSADERQTALVAANRLLERIIEQQRDDLRLVDWRFDLGRSLLYQEAEPYYLNILYRGGTPRDRGQLAQIMEHAAGNFALLRAEVGREFERLDRIAPGKYEELERSGRVDRLEGMQPRIAYMERWVKFYRALAREEKDALRTQELTELLDELRNRSGLLEVPHRESHVQAQARLMAGIAARLLGDAVPAAKDLQSAADTVSRITNQRERADLVWVGNLAAFELVKLERDQGRFERAWELLRQFQSEILAENKEGSGLELSAALLSASLHEIQAERARAAGQSGQAQKSENMRFEPLMRLAKRGAAERDAVYSAVYESLDPQADPAGLHPFAGCALIAGLLADSGRAAGEIEDAREAGESSASSTIAGMEARRIALLDRAVTAAEHFHRIQDRVPPELRSEIAYGLAIAQFQRGRRLEAARGFLAVARDDPRFRLAEHSAAVAVQIASELAEDPSLRDRRDVRELHLEAMKTLAGGFPESDEARYRQFFMAQTLFDGARFEEAAEAYAKVRIDHEYYVQASFLRIRALVAALHAGSDVYTSDAKQLEGLVDAVVEAAAAFRDTAEISRESGFDPRALADYLAESEVLSAEAKLELGAEHAAWVLERLGGFEDRYSDRGRLVGRVLRARILAYEHLDRWAEAEQAIPDFVRREPRGAGATLQGLFDSIRREIDQLTRRGRAEEARRKTAAALLLARQIHAWAGGVESGVGEEERYAVDVQLAEALLGAERFTEAQEVFARCMAVDAKRYDDGRARDLRAIHGAAESLYRLKSYEAALPLFNRLSRDSKPGDAMRFQALLRDLQCRTELNHPPEGIIKVIRQQKFLEGELGGFRADFEALLKLNESRQGSSK